MNSTDEHRLFLGVQDRRMSYSLLTVPHLSEVYFCMVQVRDPVDILIHTFEYTDDAGKKTYVIYKLICSFNYIEC